jgi:glycosyltransferase involved in cell wall biosynthesis
MFYLRWVWRHALAIRTVNAVEVPNLLRQLGIPPNKILVLPSLYIDFNVFRSMPDLRHEYDVIFVGRLAANKGLFTLLEAIAQTRITHPKMRVGILGQGPLLQSVRNRIRMLNLTQHVSIIDHFENASDLARFYNQAKMLVCASTAEGGPRVTVEAMACGTAVISTPVGIMTELLRDGENGLLVGWDAFDLANKISLLLDDDMLRERLGNNGRLAVQGFQADSVIAQYAHGLQRFILEPT